MRPQLVLSFFLAFGSLSATASPEHQENGLLRRADTPTKASSGSGNLPTAGEGDAIEGDATPTDEDNKPKETAPSGTAKDSKNSNGSKTTDPPSSKKSGSDNKSSKATSQTKTRKISADVQAGTVVMQTPAALDGYQLYKIGNPVTFKWNYTNVLVAPTAINVGAYCTDGANYFPILTNVSADTTLAVWDTGDYQATATIKLPMATYTLFIYDASAERTAIPSPGHLQAYSLTQFGMYTPKPYVNYTDYDCAVCNPNAGNPLLDPQATRIMLGVSLICTMSFVWFITGVL